MFRDKQLAEERKRHTSRFVARLRKKLLAVWLALAKESATSEDGAMTIKRLVISKRTSQLACDDQKPDVTATQSGKSTTGTRSFGP